jgi:CTP synthase
MVNKMEKATEVVNIAMVGKYFKTGDYMLGDVYISVIESLKHAAAALGKKLSIAWLDSGDFDQKETKDWKKNRLGLKKFDGIVVPGGFGGRGIEGKINVVRYAREHKIPYFGLCYGMQLAVIEYARNVLGLKVAHTREIEKETQHPVIDVMPEQLRHLQTANYGGSMRLGSYPAHLKKGSLARKLYGEELIHERHRHRYEVNPEYVSRLEKGGLVFSGTSPDGKLMEIMELPRKTHPFFVGTQFHPEFKTSPLKPHPLFLEFMKTSATKRKSK